jgi:hypothetical protein
MFVSYPTYGKLQFPITNILHLGSRLETTYDHTLLEILSFATSHYAIGIVTSYRLQL